MTVASNPEVPRSKRYFVTCAIWTEKSIAAASSGMPSTPGMMSGRALSHRSFGSERPAYSANSSDIATSIWADSDRTLDAMPTGHAARPRPSAGRTASLGAAALATVTERTRRGRKKDDRMFRRLLSSIPKKTSDTRRPPDATLLSSPTPMRANRRRPRRSPCMHAPSARQEPLTARQAAGPPSPTGCRWRRTATSSAALQCEYRDAVFNRVATPGHADCSEDTYRVLSAVDCAVMLIDAAKGLEAQTMKLFEVCAHRNIPIITVVNKWDRPGLDALELMDEVQQRTGLLPTPITWPVGQSGDFRGVLDRATGEYTKYTRTDGGATIAGEETYSAEAAADLEGEAWTTAV